jgi:hypothetical protein
LNELDLDRCFWREVSTSPKFREWLIARTKFSGRNLELVTDELWHQKWYRDPETKLDSETDILLIFRERESSERYALHIENKPAHRKWEIDQAKNYRKRAINRMIPWNYVDFQVVLLAPTAFVRLCPDDVAHFDLVISYEDVGIFVPEFAMDSSTSATSNPD